MLEKTPTSSVFVTGAEFTRAFVASAPLLVDDFNNETLAATVRQLPRAYELLNSETERQLDGQINIESLMTRLHKLMPYDHGRGVVDEYSFLFSELRRSFLDRITESTANAAITEHALRFAHHCAATHATCITFNYDDYLDRSLRETNTWNPSWGYGFFCRPATSAVSNDLSLAETQSNLTLLKLHGSINWYPRVGYTEPYTLDSIVHTSQTLHQSLFEPNTIDRHLGTEPIIVPPILTKENLESQPVLRLVWTEAFDRLTLADEVTFIGYSFPTTDLATQTMFSEALKDVSPDSVFVVDFKNNGEKDQLRNRYRSLFGDIPEDNFYFDGAKSWIESTL